MGLFSRKKVSKELTQEDKELLLEVLKEDKARWERTFPIPCFNINTAIEKLTQGKELTSSDKETCVSGIGRYISQHKEKEIVKKLKDIKKKL